MLLAAAGASTDRLESSSRTRAATVSARCETDTGAEKKMLYHNTTSEDGPEVVRNVTRREREEGGREGERER